MAAYQPTSGEGLGWKIPDFASTIMDARRAQLQEEHDRWQKLSNEGEQKRLQAESEQRIKHQTFEDQNTQAGNLGTVIEHVNTLSNAGLGLQAEEFAGAHGFHAPHNAQPAQPQASGQPAQPQESQAPGHGGQFYDPAAMGKFAQDVVNTPGQTNLAQSGQPEPGSPPIYQPNPAPSGDAALGPKPDLHRWEVPGSAPEGGNPLIMGPNDIATAMRAQWADSDPATRPSEHELNALIAQHQHEAETAIASAKDWRTRQMEAEVLGAPVAPTPAPQAPAVAQAQTTDYNPQVQGSRQMAPPAQPQIQTFTGPNGQTFRIDPMEARRAQEEQNKYRAAQFLAHVGGVPSMAAAAPEYAALIASGEGVKAGDVFGMQKAEMVAKAKAAEDAAKAEERLRSMPSVEDKLLMARNRDRAIMFGKGGEGAPTQRAEKQAEDVGGEILKTYGEDIGAKGIAVAQQKLHKQIDNAKKGNPVDMTNLVDAMIRTNTGRAAIKAQYDLYVQHSGGAFDQFDKWLETAKTGGLGEGITKNLLGASQNSLAELYDMGAEGQRKFHKQYDTDARTKTPAVKHKVEALGNNIFGSMATPQDVEAIQWAKAHSNDPRADVILKAHGLK